MAEPVILMGACACVDRDSCPEELPAEGIFFPPNKGTVVKAKIEASQIAGYNQECMYHTIHKSFCFALSLYFSVCVIYVPLEIHLYPVG